MSYMIGSYKTSCDRASLEKSKRKLDYLVERNVATWSDREDLAAINRRIAELDFVEQDRPASELERGRE